MTIALNQCLQGDCLEILPDLIAAGVRVQCVVTSPPYWGLRDYDAEGQLGLEPTPQEYVGNLVRVFDLVKEILTDDGTLWLNLGDSSVSHLSKRGVWDQSGSKQAGNPGSLSAPSRSVPGLAAKNLVGIPWRVAFALQDAGWILRSDIIWAKPNPMTESVKDRPTRSYEHIFLFSKTGRYFYDHEAAKEPAAALNVHDYTGQGYEAPGQSPHQGTRRLQSPQALSFARHVNEPERPGQTRAQHRPDRNDPGPRDRVRKYHSLCPTIDVKGGNQGAGFIKYSAYDRNWRDVWTIPTQPCKEAHFAVFPEKLVRRCLVAGTRPGDTVFDPFMGSGTAAVVAAKMGCHWLGIEINPKFIEIQERRLELVEPLFKAAGI